MGDQEAFQAHLDAHPDDHFARMTFADWLDDRGDPRAAGYRALGQLGLRPYRDHGWPGGSMSTHKVVGYRYEWWNEEADDENSGEHPECVLPWYRHLKGGYVYEGDDGIESTDYLSRREAEDAAALAYVEYEKEVISAQV